MSLLTDPDYLIHQLRLTYLRHVNDPYGPRVLTLNPGYTSNPHISASGLADQELWPEIAMPSSPTNDGTLFKDGNKRHSGFPGANLNYTHTIVGQNRTGAMGMRVNAKRASLIRDPAPIANSSDINGKRHRSDSEPTPVVPSPGPQELDPAPEKPVTSILLRRQSVDAAQLEEAPAVPAVNVPPKVLPFKPPFARAAEMEARRKIRMRSRFASTGTQPRPVVILEKEPINPEVSDEESSAEEDSDLAGNDMPLESEDFFDTENSFGPRIVLDASVSDGLLSTSNSGMSTSHSSGAGVYNNPNLNVHPAAPQGRLSPVREGRDQFQQENEPSTPPAEPSSGTSKMRVTPRRTYKSEGSYFELVVPPMQGRSGQSNDTQNSEISQGQGWNVDPASNVTPVPGVASPSSHVIDERPQQTLTFTRVKVPSLPTRPTPSGLSLLLASKASKTDNPFSELYALISSRSNPLSLEVIYPFSDNPRKAVILKVRPDATVEEVIGFALWTYWEESLNPKLDDVEEAKKKDRLSAAGWSLRITEDGDVDDDFPAMDRMAKMSKFSFEGYAILSETPAQAEQNHMNEAKIVRRLSRVMVAKKKTEPTQNLAPPGGANVATSSSLSAQAPMSTSIGGGSSISQGPQQFLRVKVDEDSDVHFLTTIPVKESMYMEDVLESVCRKRRINDPKQWCLVYDLKILIPLDRTVRSLQGNKEIFLLKREHLSRYDIRRQHTRSTDPNASIFTPISEVPEQQYSAALDFTRAYKKYTVYRKMPMLVVRHERILAMDGDYIHVMPSQTRAFLDSMKTSSHHIRSVVACTQSAKSSSNFKLVVTRDGGNKRYDFEAENPKIAAEIVRSIRDLRSKRVDRSSTVGRSRRSRPPT